ncbi:beta-glucosidase [Streptomyces sp. NL15-2K]|nr:beta-glucosidase [Streptomyces sp. NL15-2K]
MVLLDNDGTLPLTPGERRILVVGPAADDLRIHFGTYTSVALGEMPLGMRAVMEGRVPGVDPKTFVFTDIFQTRIPAFEGIFEAEARKIHPDALTVLEALRQIDARVDFSSLAGSPRTPRHPRLSTPRQCALQLRVPMSSSL